MGKSMDYKDFQFQSNDFWFKAKNGLIDILMKKIPQKKNMKILSVGIGSGDELKILDNYGKIYVLDININALKLIEKGFVSKKLADACHLPYHNNSFDIVVSFDVFEHISNDSKAISEIYRVLKDQGKLIFTVPAFQFIFSSFDRFLSHKRRYNKRMLKKLLKNFKDLKLYYWNSILFVPIAVQRIFVNSNMEYQVNLPPFLNDIFYSLLKIENKFIKHNISFPFGLSIAGICKKY